MHTNFSAASPQQKEENQLYEVKGNYYETTSRKMTEIFLPQNFVRKKIGKKFCLCPSRTLSAS
jgi:hypothetical protein